LNSGTACPATHISESEALDFLIKDLKEYTLEFCKDMESWESDINRRNQFKKILKVLLTDDNEMRESIVCQPEKANKDFVKETVGNFIKTPTAILLFLPVRHECSQYRCIYP